MKSVLIKAALASIMPTSGLRRWAACRLLGHEIDPSARIGPLTLLAVDSMKIGRNVRIGMLNIFKGPIAVTIGADTRIGRNNRFSSSWHITQARFADRNYTPRLVIGEKALVLNDHFFDVFGLVEIGDGSWIAGYGSQFWTHGLSVTDRDIVIGRNNYIGSAVRFSPGARIGDRNIVALGSVVFSKIDANESLISGFPAKPIRSISEDLAAGRYRFSFEDW
ncbi:acyltransferase [Aureimonas psammosilenae]|uniref:acyltransferase n=1 Tax=Aureimonas psammosilenae TaxID=2495496 RepID=UPI001260D36D|nr:hypothetical protein [Aureimonas psammosilenae]